MVEGLDCNIKFLMFLIHMCSYYRYMFLICLTS